VKIFHRPVFRPVPRTLGNSHRVSNSHLTFSSVFYCYANINILNACNHLATSYSHIPKTCAFDCYTNTCINISTFLEQFCLWSKHFFSQCSDTKIHASFRFLFRNLELTHFTLANTHMKGINFTLNLLQSFIYNPPLSLSLWRGNIRLIWQCYLKHINIFYTTNNHSSHDNTAL